MENSTRINKYLAEQGYTTRRGADELISRKCVFINGKIAVLGDKVAEGDVVEVKDKKKPKDFFYFAFNKPKGLMTEDIVKTVNVQKDIFPVGRLDKQSHGLIILTNDGRITDRLLNPKYDHEKEYTVITREKLRSNFKEKMEGGVNIEGYQTQPCHIRIKRENEFDIVITEGKKHQIRRMCVALFNDVKDLKRTRIMNVRLGKLAVNSIRNIEGEELETFIAEIGL
jgi:23S rRNA pseudouridine2604 synthase